MSDAQFMSFPATLTARASDVQRVEEAAGGIFDLEGTIALAGYGEAICAVNFPIRFIEKPSITTGGELDPSSTLQNGGFAIINGLVKDWKFDARPDTGQEIFSGATFAIVVSGQPEQNSVFHYHLRGRALRNPV